MAKTTILGEEVKNGKETGQKVEVVVWRRQSGTYVCGMPGSGKSGFLHTVIQQDISQGRAVIVIDPHDDLIFDTIATMPEEMLEKTYLLDMEDEAYPFGLNLFEYKDFTSERERIAALDRIMHVFHRLWPKTMDAVLLNDILPNITLTFLEHKGLTFDDIPQFLTDEAMRKRLTRNLRNSYVRNAWEAYNRKTSAKQQVARESLEFRLGDFLRNSIVRNILSQETSTINIRRSIEQREILLIKLPIKRLGETASLIGTILISLIHQATFSFADIAKEKRPTFSLFVDEFQNFDSPDFAELFKEGRKFGARVTIANQDRGDLIDENRRATTNAYTIISFRPTPDDASELAPLFLSQEARVQPEDIYRNVLDHLYEHNNPAVVAFWETYVTKLERAARERETHAYFNFGAGEVAFNPIFLKEEVIEPLRLLLYNAQKTGCLDDFVGTLDKKHYSQVVRGVARLLRFEDYLHWYYDDDATCFTASVNVDLGRKIAEHEQLRELLVSYLASEDDLVRFYYLGYMEYVYMRKLFFDGEYSGKVCVKLPQAKPLLDYLKTHKDKPIEECRSLLQERAQENAPLAMRYQSLHSYLSYLMPLYQPAFEEEIAMKRSQLTAKIAEEHRLGRYYSKYEGRIYKPWWEKLEDWLSPGESVEAEVERKLPNEKIVVHHSVRFSVSCTVAQALAGMANEESFLKLLVEGDGIDSERLGGDYHYARYWYHGKTPEEFKRLLTEECKEKYASYEPRSTPEKLLATVRTGLATEIAEVEAKLQPLLQKRDLQIAERQRELDARKAKEKRIHDAFIRMLDDAIVALIKEPLGKKTMPAKSEVVQTLLSLPQRHALVRVGSDIYTMQTLQTLPKVPVGEQKRRYQQIQEQTREKYCRSRTDVEKAIQQKHSTLLRNEAEEIREEPTRESDVSSWMPFEELP